MREEAISDERFAIGDQEAGARGLHLLRTYDSRLRTLLLCLLLGAVTTVAVAWVFALRVVVPLRTQSYVAAEGLCRGTTFGTDLWCQVKRRPGLLVVCWEPVQVDTGRTGPTFSGELLFQKERDFTYVMAFRGPSNFALMVRRRIDPQAVPRWARGCSPSIPVTWSRRALAAGAPLDAVSARGWPRSALWYEATFLNGVRTNRGGIEVPAKFKPWLGPGPVLPCRLLPSGFAVDTAFYGAVWFGLLFVPGYTARARRRHRGLCPDCAYDLSHAEHRRCPECGWGEGTEARRHEGTKARSDGGKARGPRDRTVNRQPTTSSATRIAHRFSFILKAQGFFS